MSANYSVRIEISPVNGNGNPQEVISINGVQIDSSFSVFTMENFSSIVVDYLALNDTSSTFSMRLDAFPIRRTMNLPQMFRPYIDKLLWHVRREDTDEHTHYCQRLFAL